MFRALHVFLTVAALLACPLNCMGSMAARAVDDERVDERAQGCRCCHKQSRFSEDGDSQNRESPSRPDNGCSCGNCLCRGAIVTNDDLAFDVTSAALDLPLLHVSATETEPAGARRATAGSFPPYAMPSGRLIRYALQSLLL